MRGALLEQRSVAPVSLAPVFLAQVFLAQVSLAQVSLAQVSLAQVSLAPGLEERFRLACAAPSGSARDAATFRVSPNGLSFLVRSGTNSAGRPPG
jgi:hypothetical protein